MKTIFFRLIIGICLISACALIPWAIVLGASTKVITTTAVIIPLIGIFFSRIHGISLYTLLAGIRWLIAGLPITLGIPTMGAMLSLSFSAKARRTRSVAAGDAIIHLMLPLLCFILFVMHPIGKDAVIYTSYWIIPMALWALRTTGYANNILLRTIQSTFITHALGSVLWLYTIPMTAAQWLSLIPVVAVERLIIAGIGSMIVYGIMHGRSCIGAHTHSKCYIETFKQ